MAQKFLKKSEKCNKKCIRKLYAICTRFQATFEKSMMFSSFLNLQNRDSSKGLVNISAYWSSVQIPSILISPLFTWSLRKWWRISICLVLECWTGLVAIFTHFHYHTTREFHQISHHSQEEFASSITIVHNNFRPKYIPLRRLKEPRNFASLKTKKQEIFQEIGNHRKCSCYQPCTPQNPNPKNQPNQNEHPWDTINQY